MAIVDLPPPFVLTVARVQHVHVNTKVDVNLANQQSDRTFLNSGTSSFPLFV